MFAAMPTVGMLPGAGVAPPTVGTSPASADTESRQVSVTVIKKRFILRSPSVKLEKMQEVSADKGYTSAKNLKATVAHGAVPYIPFKSNAQPDRGSDLGQRCSFFTISNALNSWPTITNGQTSKQPFR
jgi:hypothetical protein